MNVRNLRTALFLIFVFARIDAAAASVYRVDFDIYPFYNLAEAIALQGSFYYDSQTRVAQLAALTPNPFTASLESITTLVQSTGLEFKDTGSDVRLSLVPPAFQLLPPAEHDLHYYLSTPGSALWLDRNAGTALSGTPGPSGFFGEYTGYGCCLVPDAYQGVMTTVHAVPVPAPAILLAWALSGLFNGARRRCIAATRKGRFGYPERLWREDAS